MSGLPGFYQLNNLVDGLYCKGNSGVGYRLSGLLLNAVIVEKLLIGG